MKTKLIGGLCWLAALGVAGFPDRVAAASQGGRPNVVLIMSDDQGFGDVGIDGNPIVRTPNLDRLARSGARLEHFYVSPVCAPTRASLMTGRYNYRTGAVDTFLGRAMMRADEVTLAEMLSAAGYRTAIFGKWHLGDNYPLRPNDQGFQEALVLRGGGIAQPSDPPEWGGDSYFDPVLQHNGRELRTRGYCSDVFTNAAIDHITKVRDQPFFVYLAFNAPHAPLQVPQREYRSYKHLDLGPDAFPKQGQPISRQTDPEVTARIYGMVTNIDDNVGRLLERLDSLGLARDTIVVFLTDNGPQQPRFNGGMRGRKGMVYEGGIRVPCFVRWPGRITAGTHVETPAAHIDLAPTLLDACSVARPKNVAFDGRSLLPILTGEPVDWPDRTLFAQWHRGDAPERYRAFSARASRYKLVRPETSRDRPVDKSLELYDVVADPFELHDIAAEQPEVVARLRAEYDRWFDDVGRAQGYAPPRIVLGSEHENPSVLTRQDWRGPQAGWAANSIGHWEVEVAAPGRYDVTLRFAPRSGSTTARLTLGNVTRQQTVQPGQRTCVFQSLPLAAGPGRLEAWVDEGGKRTGVLYVDVNRLD